MPLMRSASLRAKCHLVEAVEVIKAVTHRWPGRRVKFGITNRPKAVAHHKGWPGWRVIGLSLLLQPGQRQSHATGAGQVGGLSLLLGPDKLPLVTF